MAALLATRQTLPCSRIKLGFPEGVSMPRSARLLFCCFASLRATPLNSFGLFASRVLLPQRARRASRARPCFPESFDTQRSKHFLLVIALCLGTAIAALAQAQKRPTTEKDIFQFNWIGDPQISPDGSRVAFVRVTVDEKKTGYDTAIWSVSTHGDEQPRRMTDGKHDSSPRWSPDGKWLVFVRAPESSGPAAMGAGGAGAPGRGQSPQLYLLPVSGGGESWKITDLPRAAGGPAWSPDGKMIAFTSDTSGDDLAKQRKKDGATKDKSQGK